MSAWAAGTAPRLSFTQPASKWTEAIPLGNGRLGAMDLGGLEDEHYQINEGALWGGARHDYSGVDRKFSRD